VKATVLGAGSWGTTFAQILWDAGTPTVLWARSLGEAMGAGFRRFAGLAGMGDLVATCSSPLSRNRTFGEHLGQGMTAEQARAVTSQTAEGVTSYAPVLELARKYGAQMPITEMVAAVITGTHSVGTPRRRYCPVQPSRNGMEPSAWR
jgi:glycerol-3-phosphate dehydrogenase